VSAGERSPALFADDKALRRKFRVSSFKFQKVPFVL
jgi:hypothetical protein